MKTTAQKNGKSEALTLRDLFWLDSDDRIAQRFSFQGMMMWPLVRRAVLDTLLKLRLTPQITSPAGQSARSLWERIQHRYYRKLHNPMAIKRSFPYLIIGTGIANVLHEGRYYHRLADPFASEFPEDTLLIESSVEKGFRRPRHNREVCYIDGLDYEVMKQARHSHLSSRDEHSISLLVARLVEAYPMAEKYFRTDVVGALQSLARALPFYYESLARVLDVIQPKLLMMEDGSYGYRAYLLYWAAKRMTTAEYQHGAVATQHAAYNHATDLRPEYAQYLPQYFLTYGQFWNDQICSASKLVTVGNPWLSMNVDAATTQQSREVLIISNALHVTQMIDYALDLRRTVKGRLFRFRPHPSEAAIASVRYKTLIEAGIAIDGESLYSSIARSEFILGSFSTVLYEALAFDKKVVLIEDSFSDLHAVPGTFVSVRDREQLVAALTDFPRTRKYRTEYIWAPGWQQNYKDFLGRLS